jgi:predicted nucleic acid-binding protein
MPKVIISDTSCLIILTKIGEIDLLRQLYKTVTITQNMDKIRETNFRISEELEQISLKEANEK